MGTLKSVRQVGTRRFHQSTQCSVSTELRSTQAMCDCPRSNDAVHMIQSMQVLTRFEQLQHTLCCLGHTGSELFDGHRVEHRWRVLLCPHNCRTGGQGTLRGQRTVGDVEAGTWEPAAPVRARLAAAVHTKRPAHTAFIHQGH